MWDAPRTPERDDEPEADLGLFRELCEVDDRDLVARGVITRIGGVGEEDDGHFVRPERLVVAAALAEGDGEPSRVEAGRRDRGPGEFGQQLAAALGADGEAVVAQARNQGRALDVEVHVGGDVAERNQRFLVHEVAGAEQAALLPVPEREHDGARRRRREGPQRAADRQHDGDARRVVGGAVADRVAGAEPPAAGRRKVVVVRADHDELVRVRGSRNHGHDVRARDVEGLHVGSATGARGETRCDRLEAIDDPLARCEAARCFVATALERVGGERLYVGLDLPRDVRRGGDLLRRECGGRRRNEDTRGQERHHCGDSGTSHRRLPRPHRTERNRVQCRADRGAPLAKSCWPSRGP
jgi:hypothetical protein